MTDNSDSSDQTSVAKAASEQKVAVTVQLPVSLAKAIKRRASRLGQSYNEVILAALQHLLEKDDPNQVVSSHLTTVADLAELVARINALEAMSSRVEDLEGKWVAF